MKIKKKKKKQIFICMKIVLVFFLPFQTGIETLKVNL